MQIIASRENSLIKHIIKLKNKKYRNEYNEYLIEGAKLLKEAIEEKANVKTVVIEEGTIHNDLIKQNLGKYLLHKDYVQVPSHIFKLISEVEAPQGVLAIIEKNMNEKKLDYSKDIILALEDIQDPR